MASINTEPNGRRRIQFIFPSFGGALARRKAIRLGPCSMRQAHAIQRLVEDLVAARSFGLPPDPDSIRHLNRLADVLHKRIASTGLCTPRASASRSRTLGAVIDEFCEKRQDVKATTRAVWKQAFGSIRTECGSETEFRSINPGHADDWRQKLIGDGLRDGTIRKRTRVIEMLFNWATRRGYWEGESPFAHLPQANVEGREKPYVPAAHALAVIDALPSPAWKVLVALSRFAGLRVPSEAIALRWEMVDWDRDRIAVPVPKLAHISGKATRVIPIFAALRPWLMAASKAASTGDSRVVALPLTTDAYLRKYVSQTVKQAAVPAWSSIFHAMRGSCETDLAARFPLHVVVAWIGHDMKIAQKHYLKVLDSDYMKAATINCTDSSDSTSH